MMGVDDGQIQRTKCKINRIFRRARWGGMPQSRFWAGKAPRRRERGRADGAVDRTCWPSFSLVGQAARCLTDANVIVASCQAQSSLTYVTY